MVQLKQKDRNVVERFTLDHASRILKATNLWELHDENYELKDGRIKRRTINRDSKKSKKSDSGTK